MRCLLHIGTEKTGTTSIQTMCGSNRQLLASNGYLYPESLGRNSHLAVPAYCCDDQKSDELRRPFMARTRAANVGGLRKIIERDLAEEVSRSTAHTMIVSNEHLHSRLSSPAEIERLRDLLSPHCDEFSVLVYLRRQDTLACSAHVSRIKFGSSAILPIFPEGMPRYYNFRELIEYYASAFGLPNIKVKLFERDSLVAGDAAADFRSQLHLDTPEALAIPKRRNESLSPVALYFLRNFNRTNPPWKDGAPNPDRGNIVALLERLFAGPGPMPSRAAARSFYERFAETNAWVRETFFPERPRLFSEDFSSYPETAQSEQPSIDELQDLFGALWAEKQKEAAPRKGR